MSTDYYDILGIKKNATESEIKKAFFNISKTHHPDKLKEPDAEAKYKDITEAYAVLSDAEKREIYDKYGKDGLNNSNQGNSNNSGVDVQDMFKNMGMHFNMGGNRNEDNETVIVNYNATLEELYTGKNVSLDINRKCLCATCKGTGSKDCKNYVCVKCKGQKIEIQIIQMGPMIQQIPRNCSLCKGTGTSGNFTKCDTCNGNKCITEKTTVKYTIPAGAVDRQTIILENAGNELPNDQKTKNKTHETVRVMIIEKAHTLYKRNFNIKGKSNSANILLQLELPLVEALTGFSRKIKFLDDSIISIKYNGNVLKPGDVLFIKNKGMPKQNTTDKFGDLYVHIDVKFPSKLQTKFIKNIIDILGEPNVNYDANLPDAIDLTYFDSNQDIDTNQQEQEQQQQQQQQQQHNHNHQQHFHQHFQQGFPFNQNNQNNQNNQCKTQ